jgi:transposase
VAAIAADLGVGTNAVYQWDKLARTKGIEALKLKPRSGRKVKLDEIHWDKLREMVLAGPSACGFETELWTLPLIGELIQTEFGVEYHDDHLSRFMRRLGFSRQKPAVRARERDEEAVQKFVREEFPRIEKKRGGAVRR